MIDKILGKIPTMFQRDWNATGRPIIDQITPGCEWVLAGEGHATRKWDGTPIAVIESEIYRRLDNKPGRTMPANWIPAQPEPDAVTGEQPGWVPLDGAKKEDQLIILTTMVAAKILPGTYEFCGPKVNGNPEGFREHILCAHGGENIALPRDRRDFQSLREFLSGANIEGIVFYHPDGRMAKIKTSDFGIKRKSR